MENFAERLVFNFFKLNFINLLLIIYNCFGTFITNSPRLHFSNIKSEVKLNIFIHAEAKFNICIFSLRQRLTFLWTNNFLSLILTLAIAGFISFCCKCLSFEDTQKRFLVCNVKHTLVQYICLWFQLFFQIFGFWFIKNQQGWFNWLSQKVIALTLFALLANFLFNFLISFWKKQSLAAIHTFNNYYRTNIY